MTRRQKAVLALLGLANALTLVLLATVVARSVTALPTPLPRLNVARPGECAWQAAQAMAEAGLSGAAIITPEGTLQITLTHTLPPGELPDEAAQLVWDVFDIALTLQKTGCSFTSLHVAIHTRDHAGAVRVVADVSTADLVAFNMGELDEEAFIDRVTYAVLRGE